MAYIGSTPTSQSFTAGTDYFSGNGSTTAFTISRVVASINDVIVVVENVVQKPLDAYSIVGTTLTFTSAPPSGTNNIYVRYMSTSTVAIQPNDLSVTTGKIADGVVTTTKLADGSVTKVKHDVSGSGTGAIHIPSGTTSQRPGTPQIGYTRFNTEIGYTEVYNGTLWDALKPTFVASGGTVTTSGSYTLHTFTTSSTFTVSAGSKAIEIMIVAGGAGGGYCNVGDGGGGGGGAGGLVYNSAYSVSTGSYNVVVGAGGAGSTSNATTGVNGSNSSITGATIAVGGGGGSSTRGGTASNGGSGGGAGSDVSGDTGGSGTAGQGNAGGNNPTGSLGAGGGGAGAAGTSVTVVGDTPNGGVGLQYFGSYYAGGGGGGKYSGGTGSAGSGGNGGGGNGGKGADGSAGTANTGGGGGGGGMDASSRNGGNGGSGIVIIRYLS